MPTIERNRSIWSDYHWVDHGEEWSSTWGGSEFQWQWSLLPRIRAFLPAANILEIATGCGRWTQYLKNYCDRLIGVDLSEPCIQVCERRFAAYPHMKFHVNNGTSLATVPDGSVDFVFSFDSLVHAEADVLEAYLAELAKKLSPDGVGFIHHSNLGSYPLYYSIRNLVPKIGAGLTRIGLADNDGMRALSMTAKSFARYAEQAGLQCISQEIVNWSSTRLIDCMSTFTLRSSKWTRPNAILKNSLFMREAKNIRKLSRLYPAADVGVRNTSKSVS
ncbi:MAG: class I SAM-dependent methyltransferase [Gemmatimonadaceae bacterium]|nr:class I SAM-dependent methyltransferase [Gemmatimonadaceae bacterium]